VIPESTSADAIPSASGPKPRNKLREQQLAGAVKQHVKRGGS
jgi:hypothetical protein